MNALSTGLQAGAWKLMHMQGVFPSHHEHVRKPLDGKKEGAHTWGEGGRGQWFFLSSYREEEGMRCYSIAILLILLSTQETSCSDTRKEPAPDSDVDESDAHAACASDEEAII
jgi:hypothetical protein